MFESGKKHRLRLVNTAVEGHFQFSIDGHNFTVISNYLVPIVPYKTDNILISIGQRYDIIIEASAAVDDYWLRAGWQSACINDNAANITGIIRYDPSSTADPVTTSTIVERDNCGEEDVSNLVHIWQ